MRLYDVGFPRALPTPATHVSAPPAFQPSGGVFRCREESLRLSGPEDLAASGVEVPAPGAGFAPAPWGVVTPLSQPTITLGELLKHVTPQNLHHEIDTGPTVGGEVW